MNAIAAAAGVSHQTVLNHFESKEGVARAVAEVLKTETVDVRYSARPGDAADAVRVLVGEYERYRRRQRPVGGHRRTPGQPGAAPRRGADFAPGVDRAHVRRCAADRRLLAADASINAIHVATDVYSWKLLRRDLGLSRSDTERS